MAADGSIIIETEIDDKKAQQELNRLTKKIDALQEKLNQKQGKQSALAEEARQIGIEYDRARKKLEQMQSGEKFYTSAHIQEQANSVKALETEWNKTAQAAEKLRTEIYDGTQQLNSMKEDAGEIQRHLAAAGPNSERMSKAMERMQKSANKFSLRLREVVRSALIFTVISQGLASLREWMGKVIKTNDEATAAIARLKGALLTMAQPLVNVIIPALTVFVNVLTRIISAAANLVSMLFGTTSDRAAEAAENLYDEANAVEGVGDAAKKAGKSLASFDEINKLSGENGASSGSGTQATGAIAPDFKSLIADELTSIVELFTGLALLALGAILTFTGTHVLLGLSLMAIGALAIADAVTSNPDAIKSMLLSSLGQALQIIGPFIAVIGVLLAVMGHILLGIGLIIAGAGLWATSTAAGDEGDFVQNILTRLQEAAAVIGPMIAVIGIVLLVAGKIATGLGLIIAGISIWAFSEVPLDGGSNLANEVVSALWNIFAKIGPFIALLGVILLFTPLPGFRGIGIGMIIAGIALFAVGEVGMNWKTLSTDLTTGLLTILQDISPYIAILGLILLFVPGMQAVGAGMLVAGIGAFIFSTVALNWDFIKGALKQAFDNAMQWWDAGPSKFFTLDYWLGLGQDMLDGLFNGLSSIGQKITEWGGNFIDGVKDFFGIHSPSTEFEDLGGYMMSGLENGVNDNSTMVVSAFSIMFNAVLALCTNNTELMKASLVAFLLYMTGEFAPAWNKTWTDCYNKASQNIQGVIAEINALNAKLASIERNITITITTVYKTVGKSSSGSSSSSRSGRASARSVSLPMQNIPALARGAVIPPNREFLAVLGDQKSGTNVEAPLDTIVQAVMMALTRSGMNADGQLIENVINLDGEVIYRNQKKVARRHGMSLTNR